MWRHLVTKFVTNASSAIWWANLQLMQLVTSGGQIWNQCNWCHKVAKFVINASGAIWCPNLQPIRNQFQTILVEKFTQVMDSIPWIRCASGDVFSEEILQSVVSSHLNSKSN